jgi:hypothetical protein
VHAPAEGSALYRMAGRRKVKPTALSTWISGVRAFRATFNYGDSDWVGTVTLKLKVKNRVGQPPSVGLSLALFNEIVTWKLAGQEDRTRGLRDRLTDDLVRKITACAFSLAHPDRDYLTRARLYVLQGIPGVSTGVASAILALTFPDQYCVIDPRIWKAIYGQNQKQFSLADYRHCLADVLPAAVTLGWPPQEVDFFAWKMTP